jgi:hypothetical protein
MAQAVDPLQVLTPPRVVEEVSGKIGQLAPSTFNEYARVWQASVHRPLSMTMRGTSGRGRSRSWTSCASAATSARRCWRTGQLRS